MASVVMTFSDADKFLVDVGASLGLKTEPASLDIIDLLMSDCCPVSKASLAFFRIESALYCFYNKSFY